MTKPISYADAGVSIDNANKAVAMIREYARATFNAGLGMTVTVAPDAAEMTVAALEAVGVDAWRVGTVIEAAHGRRYREERQPG